MASKKQTGKGAPGDNETDPADAGVPPDAITSVASVLDQEVDDEDEMDEDDPALYETDPDLVPDDVIVNVVDAPLLLPKGICRNSTVRLLEGDRVRGRYYKKMVRRHKIPGLALCANLEKEFLEKLEKKRQERLGERPPKWVQEAWALKGQEPED